jgi:hypothetical protein
VAGVGGDRSSLPACTDGRGLQKKHQASLAKRPSAASTRLKGGGIALISPPSRPSKRVMPPDEAHGRPTVRRLSAVAASQCDRDRDRDRVRVMGHGQRHDQVHDADSHPAPRTQHRTRDSSRRLASRVTCTRPPAETTPPLITHPRRPPAHRRLHTLPAAVAPLPPSGPPCCPPTHPFAQIPAPYLPPPPSHIPPTTHSARPARTARPALAPPSTPTLGPRRPGYEELAWKPV